MDGVPYSALPNRNCHIIPQKFRPEVDVNSFFIGAKARCLWGILRLIADFYFRIVIVTGFLWNVGEYFFARYCVFYVRLLFARVCYSRPWGFFLFV